MHLPRVFFDTHFSKKLKQKIIDLQKELEIAHLRSLINMLSIRVDDELVRYTSTYSSAIDLPWTQYNSNRVQFMVLC